MEGAWSVSWVLFGIQKTGIVRRLGSDQGTCMTLKENSINKGAGVDNGILIQYTINTSLSGAFQFMLHFSLISRALS